jgi:rod shape-determining protein MreC
VILLIGLSVSLMVLDHRGQYLGAVREYLSLVVEPVRFLVNLPNATGTWFRESLSSRHALQEENAVLRTQQLVLKTQIQKLEALEAENLRLRALMDSSFQVGKRQMLIAELMSVDLDPYRHQIEINKGRLDHVYVGQPLLDSEGVMGQIAIVDPFSSTAMLITDPGHAIPVQVNRTGLRTIALGTGNTERLELPHIPTNADIRVGDLLVTSGLGKRFPVGYPVGEIIEIDQTPGRDFSLVIAKPRARLNRSREVLLIWPAIEEPFSVPEPAAETGDDATEETSE